MVPNRILERASKGEKALGLSFKEASGELVDMAGRMGLDFVAFDAQHTPITPTEIGDMCHIADAHGITVTLRIPDAQESTILSFLDRGVRVITVPNLLTRQQAEDLVKYSFFAPLGLRSATSVATLKGQIAGDHPRLYADTNANTVVVPQLENVSLLENLDDILEVDGLNYFGAGAEDMAQSLGLTGQPGHPKVAETYAKMEAKLAAAGKGMWGPLTEAVAVFDLTKSAIAGLLEKHGRSSKLGW
jgi:2-keto-3-deoxy-L-rhamnonate aldolase RhmA